MASTNSMETIPQISKEILAHDFQNAFKGKLEDAAIESINKQILSDKSSYPATGSINENPVFFQLQISVQNGKTFNGIGYGSTAIGIGGFSGEVQTDDIDLLYANTASMHFNYALSYTGVFFFDKNATLLGVFLSGAIASFPGLGGGSGSWS